MTTTLRDAALEYARAGYRVFPILPRGKKPAIEAWQKRASSDPEKVSRWWKARPDYNIGIVAGDGLAVLDVDPAKGGAEALRALYAEHEHILTRAVKTGSGGIHLYLADDPDAPLPQSSGTIGPGLDTRAGGKGYAVAPPSVHPNGTRYEWVNKRAIREVPDWLRGLAGERKTSARPDAEEVIPEGSRDSALTSLAGSMRHLGMGQTEILAALLEVNATRCVPPLEPGDVERIARSVSRYTPGPGLNLVAAEDEFEADPDAKPPEPRPRVPIEELGMIDHTDEWAVRQILPALRDRIRYAPGAGNAGTWYVWAGYHWALDHALRYEMAVRDELTRLAWRLEELAGMAPKKAEGEPLRKTARRYQSADGIASVVRLLRALVACGQADFDLDPMLLNTPGGIVDLRTGEVRQGTPADMMARATGVAPASGPAPLWQRFLSDLTGGDVDLERFLQRMGGYALTGDVSEKSLWFIWGDESDTGKSTFIRVLGRILGSYADSVDVAAFIGTAKDRVPADLARLPGVRLVTATEPAAGQAWDEKRIKAITGGDDISARFLYGQWFTFRPQFKILIVGNHEPELKQVDDAMLRRVHIIPFNHKVPRDRQIENLSDRLVDEEGPQILQWLLDGCREWQDDGLAPPDVVLQRTSEYAAEEDTLQQWLDEECEFGEHFETPRQDLFGAWAAWCRTRGEDPGGSKAFKRRMDPKRKAHGLGDAQVGDRRLRGYRGIRLRPRVELGTEEFLP